MKLSEQLKKQLEQVETSLNICQEILNKKTKEEETEEWLKNWSRWVDWPPAFSLGVQLQKCQPLAQGGEPKHISVQQHSCNEKAPYRRGRGLGSLER